MIKNIKLNLPLIHVSRSVLPISEQLTLFFTSASNESRKDQIGRKRAEQQGRQSEGEREKELEKG